MNKRIAGKNIVITGASSGIGAHLAERVAESQANPILVARSKEKLEELTKKIYSKYGVPCTFYVCDVGNLNEWQRTMEQIGQDFEQIHVLINNAGFGIFQPVNEMTIDHIQQMFAVNVQAVIQASQFFLQSMLNNKEGHIVNIASMAGKMATPKATGYAATKHAVLGFTHGLRLEVEKENIFVTAVNLGPVGTNFFQTADPSGEYEKAVKRYLLHPEKVATKIVNKLYRPIREINLPIWMELGSRLYRLFPGLVERLFKRQFFKK
jgi:uncharacterized protein